MMDPDTQREQILDAVEELDRAGVMSPTGHINVSSRLSSDHMLLSSTGLIHELRAQGLALVDLQGQLHEGEMTASTTRIISMHTAIYGARPEARAILHTHSPHLTVFALAGKPLPCRYEPLLRRGQRASVPVVGWQPRGAESFSQAIAAAARDHRDTAALLLANHGVVFFGPSPLDAVKLAIVLEEAAAAELRAQVIGGTQGLPDQAFETVVSQPQN